MLRFFCMKLNLICLFQSSDESYNNPSVGSKQAMSIGSVEDTLSLDLLTQQQLQQFPGNLSNLRF